MLARKDKTIIIQAFEHFAVRLEIQPFLFDVISQNIEIHDFVNSENAIRMFFNSDQITSIRFKKMNFFLTQLRKKINS